MKYLPLILMVICHPLWAKDILWMNNGDRLTGTIEEIGDESVRISLPYTGAVTVKRDAIKRWRLEHQDKPKATAKGGFTLFKDEQDERKAWLWTGSGDLNIKLKHKDKHTNNVNFKGKTELANLDWRYSLSGEYSYETSDSVTDNHDYKLNPTIDYFFDQQWFVRSSLNAEYDMLESNYLSLDYGTGPGYRFWNEKRRRLEFVAQGGLRKTYFREESGIGLLFKGNRIIDYPFASMNWDYRQPIPIWREKLELFSQGRYLLYLDQPSPYITLNRDVTGSVGLRYYFNDHLRLSWSSEMEWEDGEVHFVGLEQKYKETEFRHLLNLGASF
ncbi:DUF481 domain-containing protein [Aeromonas veronii]|uniref:DUF481 domain-containing protein n=1 Tax=Aeromonas TaxID=642 RepID=UPI0011178AF4|nr:DUF481 domain-containing protein [Aeromonas veronii]MBF3237164.1 DUF481 domain-containing protein [Aeromonas veronii]